MRRNDLASVVRESGRARVSRVSANTDPPDTWGEHQPGHSHCTREGKLKEKKMRLFPRLLIKQWGDLIFGLCSCFHSQEALPSLDFTFVFFEILLSFLFFFLAKPHGM